MTKQLVEFIESYWKIGHGDYQWNDNHGELIRCQDCQYYDMFPNGANGTCVLGVDERQSFYPWDYCSKGERKDAGSESF